MDANKDRMNESLLEEPVEQKGVDLVVQNASDEHPLSNDELIKSIPVAFQIDDIQTSLSQAVVDASVENLYGRYEYEREGVPWWMPVNALENEDDLNAIPGASAPDESEIAPPAPSAPSAAVVPGALGGAGDDNSNGNDNGKGDQSGKKNVAEDTPKTFLELLETRKVQKVILLDFHVGTRKFSLYTSVLLFLVVATNIASGLSKFYETKGYFFNAVVIGYLVYGLFVAYMSSDPIKSFETHKYARIVYNLQFYWIWSWITATLLFGVAIYYIVMFPHKYRNFCDEHKSCHNASDTVITMGVISLCVTLMLYMLIIFFYMDRVAKQVIYSGHLGVFAYRKDWDCYVCCFSVHKHCYRFRRIFKNFRRSITRATGLRLLDVVYCQCWFRSCRRSQNHSEWKPISLSKNESEYNKLEKMSQKEKQKYHIREMSKNVEHMLNEKDKLMDDSYRRQKASMSSNGYQSSKERQEEIEKEKAKSKNKSKDIAVYYDYQPRIIVNPGPPLPLGPGPRPPPPHGHHPPHHGGGGGAGGVGGYGGGPACDCHLCLHDCGICFRECCDALFAFPRCLCHCFCRDLCHCCCQTYDAAVRGGPGCCHEFGHCCAACLQGLGHACKDCKGGDCNCSGGGGAACGEAVAYVGFAFLVALLFVLPLIMLAMITAPFWLLAQAITSKLKDSIPFFFVICIFCICLVIPFTLWYLLFTVICDNASSDNTLLTVFCLIWSFFHAIVNLA